MKRSEMNLSKGQRLGDETNSNPIAHDNSHGRLVDATTDITSAYPRLGESHLGEKGAIQQPEGFSTGTASVSRPEKNYQDEPNGEVRSANNIRPSTQSPPDIFRQEQAGDNRRLLTLEARGQTIATQANKFVPGQGSKSSTQGESD
jgi:hypothetical protein